MPRRLWPLLLTGILLALFACGPTLRQVPRATYIPYVTLYRGLNLFGAWQNIEGGEWKFATPAELDYYRRKGLTTFRVPLLWEDLQPTLFGPFDSGYLKAMDTFVANCAKRGERVSFTIINHAEYPANGGAVIGSAQVPAAAFYDLWRRLALHYRDDPTVWAYDLINEPYPDTEWDSAHAQGTIDAIRAVDPSKPIIVSPRDENAADWSGDFVGFRDPANRLWYEAHVYFDRSGAGTYRGTYDQEGAYPTIGVVRSAPFVHWCVARGARCAMGEYGIPGTATGGATEYDPRWLTVLANFLAYLDQHQISGTYWSAGPYGDVNSVEPDRGGSDRPQMAVLEQHRAK